MIGNSIGNNDPKSAKVYSIMLIVITMSNNLFFITMINLSRRTIAGLYSSDTDVVALFADAVPFMTIGMFFDHIQMAFQGIIRGLGR